MEGGGKGGGGRTPRGKKGRGSRGRGHSQDSPSPRTPPTASVTVASSPAPQSPSVSSSTATPSTQPLTLGRNEESKVVTKQSEPTAAVKPKEISPPPVTQTTVIKPSEMSATDTENTKTPPPPKPEIVETGKTAEVSKDDVDKQTSTSIPVTEPVEPIKEDEAKKTTTKPPPSLAKLTSPAIEKEEMELPEPPTPPVIDIPTESKVEEALSKQLTRPTAKTLVVSPPEIERSTNAPVTVEIDPSCISSPETAETSATSSQRPQRHSRSESMSPNYGYALYGPVGKPGYIGGVGYSDVDGADSTTGEGVGRRISRRESAITAMETEVKRFTKRQWILLIIFGIIDLLSGITISVQGPFFPEEAEKKGATATEYGFVFGIFEFIVFVTSPLYGQFINRLGPKTVFSVCILVTSVSVICFGLLDRIDDHTWFISLCFICRIFEALGCSGFFTATFVIIACEFPESVATTFASLETFFGLGLIVGPTVGGVLFSVGGFPLPFIVVGACLLLTGLLSGLVMPKIDKATDEDGVEEKGYGVWTILKIPPVALAALSIASTSMSLGFVSAVLEPHIRRFGLTPLQTGLVFIVNGGVYALTAPLWGYLCDYIKRPIYITVLGNLFIFISFIIIGPAPFIPFDTILWVTIIGLLIQGLGFGCCLVSGFIVGLRESMKHGLPDNMATYGVASGLWTSMISLGAWVGPSVGGVLYDRIGFREGSWLILATSFVVGITILLYTCATSAKLDIESQPLLRPSVSPPLLRGKQGLEESCAVKPTTSYGATDSEC